MKIIKALSQLSVIGLVLTVVGIAGCAQNTRTSGAAPSDLPGSTALEPALIYEEPYVPYPTYSPPIPPKTTTKAKAKKTVKSSPVTGYITHTVKAGENLYRIALRYGVSQAAIKAANGLKSNALKLGQKLRIPGGKVSSQSSPAARQVASNSAAKIAVVAPKNIASCSPAPKWGWPSQGAVTPTSSGTAKGTAININGSAQSVKAAASGTVTFSGQGTQKRPNRITISHNKSFSTVYEYYGKSLAKIGTQVTLGQTIGEVNSQTPLHFEIRCHAKALNPLYYLPG